MKTRLFLFVFVLASPMFGQGFESSKISDEMCRYFSELDGDIEAQSSSAAYSKFLGENNENNALFNSVHRDLLKSCPKYLIFSNSFSDFFMDMFSNHAGEKFNDVELMNENNQVLNVSSFSTKVLIIDFWATWCSPCVSHIPDQRVLYDRFKSKYDTNFEWLNISVDKDTTKWQTFLKSNYKPGKNLLGEVEQMQSTFGISRYPTYILVNENLEILGFEIADLNFPTLEPFEYLVDMAMSGYSSAEAWRKIKIPGTNQNTDFYQQWKKDFYNE